MKKILFLMLITTLNGYLYASEFKSENSALGVVLGKPTGLSGSYLLDKKTQVQLDFSTDYMALDYLKKDTRSFGVKGLSWLYGAGLVFEKNTGARLLTAVQYGLEQYKLPFHLFANLSFTVTNKSRLGAAIGGRYDF